MPDHGYGAGTPGQAGSVRGLREGLGVRADFEGDV